MDEEDATTAADAEGEDAGPDVDAEGADASPAADDATGAGSGFDDLVARAATHDEELAAEVARLRDRVETLETEREEQADEIADLTERLQRARADFQNYKKRQEKRREEYEARATEDLVEDLLEVRDNLRRALEQDADADVREGVEATARELDRVLAGEDVTPIDPDPGATVDPERHEVLTTVESDQPADAVADVYRPGYEMAGRVLRPAQVTVSDGEGSADADE